MAKKSTFPKVNPPSKADGSVTVVTEKAPQLNVTLPDGTTHILGKGLWGIVGSKTRYSTVTQFGGLEYVRYEYRRIPEEFRDAAFLSTFLDVVDISETIEGGEPELPVDEIPSDEIVSSDATPSASAEEKPAEG